MRRAGREIVGSVVEAVRGVRKSLLTEMENLGGAVVELTSVTSATSVFVSGSFAMKWDM